MQVSRLYKAANVSDNIFVATVHLTLDNIHGKGRFFLLLREKTINIKQHKLT